MINDKWSKYISMFTIALVVILVVIGVLIPSTPTQDIDEVKTSNITEVLDKDVVTEVSIDISEEDWKWLLENATEEEYRSGNITINGETFYNVGIRPKGNSSLRDVVQDPDTDRYSLKIDFGKYVDGQTYHGIEKLALNNMMSDPSYMKEYISYDVFQFMDIKTPEYSYTSITVNGEPWGLYLGVEVIDERYVEKNYGDTEGNLYKPETDEGMGGGPGGQKENGMQQPTMEQGQNNGQVPTMEEGQNNEQPPSMAQGGNNGQLPPMGQGQNNGQLPPGQQDNNGVMMPGSEGNNNGEAPSLNQDNNEGKFPPIEQGNNMNNPGENNFSTNEGADLKYIDDQVSSYSAVRDSAVFKKTSDKDFEAVIKMMKSLSTGENIEEYLNVDEVLRYFAVNTFLVNLDSYSGGMYHNYYLYERDGVCEILPWDLNMSFAGFSMRDGAKAVNFPIDYPVTGDLESAPLIGKLLEVPEYKEKYHTYLKKLVNEYALSGLFENTVDKLDNLINEYVKNDKTSFYTFEEYENSIPQLKLFLQDRSVSITEQLNGNQPSTEYGNIPTELNLSALGGMNNMSNGRPNEAEGMMGNINNGKPNVGGRPMGNINNPPNSESLKGNSIDANTSSLVIKYSISIAILIIILILSILLTRRFKRKGY